MVKMRQVLGMFLIGVIFSTQLQAQKNKPQIQPNIIVFYVDDLGWQDTQLDNLDNSLLEIIKKREKLLS